MAKAGDRRKAPKISGPRDKITERSSIPLPTPLSDARLEEVNDGFLRPYGAEYQSGKLDLPADFDFKAYLCWRALVYFAGEITDHAIETRYSVSVRELKSYIEPGSRHTSTDTVLSTIHKLVASVASIRYRDQGKDKMSVSNLVNFTFDVSADGNPRLDGKVEYSFPPTIRRLLSFLDPGVIWARVELCVLNRLASTHEARLYEFLARFPSRQHPSVRMTVTEIHDLLALPEDAYYRRDWKNLRRRIIDKVGAILTEFGTFDFEVEEHKEGRGGRVVEATFHVRQRSKAVQIAEQPVIVSGNPKDDVCATISSFLGA